MYTKMVREHINKNKGELFDSSYEHKRLFQLIPYKTYLKIIQRFVNENLMVRISKGIYGIPDDNGKYKSIERYYTENVGGLIVGDAFYYEYRITRHKNNEVLIYTNRLSTNTRNINNYKLKYIDLLFFDNKIKVIRALDLIENQYKIKDINFEMFAKLIEQATIVYNDKEFELIIDKIDYQYSTIQKFDELLKLNGKHGNPLKLYINKG